jgi:hypothetical protein
MNDASVPWLLAERATVRMSLADRLRRDELRVAAKSGDVARVRSLIADAVAVGARVNSNRAFHAACTHGHDDVVGALLGDVPTLDAALAYAHLTTAARHGHARIVERLLAHPLFNDDSLAAAAAAAVVQDGGTDNPLCAAVTHNHVPVIVALLRDARIDPTIAQRRSSPALVRRRRRGAIAVSRDRLFRLACTLNAAPIVELLLADARVTVASDSVYLHQACKARRADIVRLFLVDGRVCPTYRDVRSMCRGSSTPPSPSDVDIVDQLLGDARLVLDDAQLLRMLCRTSYFGNVGVVRLLLRQPNAHAVACLTGYEGRAMYHQVYTPAALRTACERRHFDVARLLLRAMPDTTVVARTVRQTTFEYTLLQAVTDSMSRLTAQRDVELLLCDDDDDDDDADDVDAIALTTRMLTTIQHLVTSEYDDDTEYDDDDDAAHTDAVAAPSLLSDNALWSLARKRFPTTAVQRTVARRITRLVRTLDALVHRRLVCRDVAHTLVCAFVSGATRDTLARSQWTTTTTL